MDKSAYILIFGTLAFIVIVIAGGVWLGGVSGQLLFLFGVALAIAWLYSLVKLLLLKSYDIP